MQSVIPPDQLQPATLQSLIEDFVTRDGAVQGHHDRPLQESVRAVERALRAGDAVLVFDHEQESFNIMPAAQWQKRALSDDDERTIDWQVDN